MSIFQGVMEEELDRNLRKQEAFKKELISYPKGYLSICRIGGVDYVYRKHREGKKIISVYIGPPGSEAARKAKMERDAFLMAKRSLAELRLEEKRLRRAIRDYAGIRN